MANLPFIGELRITGFTFAPTGWAVCNGQLLSIVQNQVLFAVLGTIYGGNGVTNFALPDLRGRAPLHPGGGWQQGAAGGEEEHTLTLAELPSHTHALQAAGAGTGVNPGGGVWGGGTQQFGSGPAAPMATAALAATGGGAPHGNMPPYAVLNVIISLTGIFPSGS